MKHHTTIRLLALLCALSLLLSLSGCGSRQDDSANQIEISTPGKDIQKTQAADHLFSLNSNPKYSLSPMVATNHANQLICDLVYENMLELDNNFQVIPDVGLILMDDSFCSEDGKTWTFKLRTDHVFHDGSPVGGNDLRMSLENAIQGDRFKGRFNNVAAVYYDTDTMIVGLFRGDTQFYKLLNIPVVKVGTFGDDHPIGSGPYMWNEDGTKLVSFAGNNGFENLPVDTVYIRQYSAAADILSAFEDGLIDVAVNDPSSVTNLGYASTNEFRTYTTTNMHFVAFNEESEFGRLSYVRNALSYGFDRRYFTDTLMTNRAVASPIPMVPDESFYPTELAAQNGFSLDHCMQVLNNYGIMDYDEDGKLELGAGVAQELRLIFIVPADSSIKAGVANRFAEDMASIGIQIDVRALSWSEYTEALENGYLTDREGEKGDTFDMYYGEVKLRCNWDLTELLQVRDEGKPDKGDYGNTRTNINFTRSTDQTYTTLIENYLSASESNRADRYYELASALLNNGELITIGFEKQEVITHRGVVKGVNPNAGNPLFDFVNWQIDLS